MVGWQRHLRNVFTQIGKRVEHNYNVSANFSCSRLESSSLVGELPYLQRLWKLPSATIPRPYYYYFQQLGISSSRQLLADSDVTPVASPLTPALALNGGKTEDQKVVSKPSKVQAVQAVLKGIKQA